MFCKFRFPNWMNLFIFCISAKDLNMSTEIDYVSSLIRWQFSFNLLIPVTIEHYRLTSPNGNFTTDSISIIHCKNYLVKISSLRAVAGLSSTGVVLQKTFSLIDTNLPLSMINNVPPTNFHRRVKTFKINNW